MGPIRFIAMFLLFDSLGLFLVVSAFTCFWVSGPYKDEMSALKEAWFQMGIGLLFPGVWIWVGSIIVILRLVVSRKMLIRSSDWFWSGGIACCLVLILILLG